MSALFKRLSNLSFLASSDSDSDDEDKENNIIGSRLETTSASEIAEELMSPETRGNENLSSCDRVVLGEKQCVDGGNNDLENVELISESSDEENIELLPDDGPAVLVREDLADEEEDLDDQDLPPPILERENPVPGEEKFHLLVDPDKLDAIFKNSLRNVIFSARQSPVDTYLATVPVRKRRKDFQIPRNKRKRLQEMD